MLEITIRHEQNIDIITLNGRLDGLGAVRLDEAAGALPADATWAAVDFTGVEFVSSAGLRSLLKLQKQLAANSGGAIFAGLADATRQVLAMSGMLKFFVVADTVPAAIADAVRRQQALAGLTEKTVSGRRYAVSRVAGASSLLDVWTGGDGLIRTNLAELELAFGIGGFGSSSAQADTALGAFLTIGRAAGVIPADGHCIPDFVITPQPEASELFVRRGIGISGTPALTMEVAAGAPFSLAELLADCRTLAKECASADGPALGFAVYAPGADYRGAHYATAADLAAGTTVSSVRNVPGIFFVGVAADPKRCTGDFAAAQGALAADGTLAGHAFALANAAPLSESSAELNDMLTALASLDQLTGVSVAQADSTLTAARIWLFTPAAARASVEKQVKLEVPDEKNFREEWAVLTRRIYHDCGRVVLTRLSGGFTSQTFRAASFDRSGRAQLPTVLKIGPRAVTDREVVAYRACVEKYILNNSTTIMGEAGCGEWAGLRYNFVGVTGADSKLIWFEDYYRTASVDKITAILDRFFTDIMKPWYGQPKLENIALYAMHDPARLFFKEIVADAKKELGIDADVPTIDCPALGRALPNPFHFYKHEYPKRQAKQRQWYTGIIHGDLNLKNILIDERENLYIIDFSECRPANITSDFARLEPIVMIELTKLDTDEELAQLLEVEQGFAATSTLGEQPQLNYRGSDPMVAKAHATVCRMRRYADQCTVFETDIIPYLLAVLEWTLPVVSYYSVAGRRKQLAMYRAALIVEQLQRLERK
ncbi:MAG TPA: phosphotransferase [bacterium]|nr:phosphotransferase [bacterium]